MSFLLALSMCAASAGADQVLAPLDITGVTEWPTEVVLDVSAIPAGDYAGYAVTVNTGGFVWEDVRWRLESPGYAVPLAMPAASPDADEFHAPALTWSGTFHQTYQGGDPLTLVAWMDQQGGLADYTNFTITLIAGTVPPASPPAAADLGALTGGLTTASGSMTSNGVAWFRFETGDIRTDVCTSLRIDTYGSSLAGGIYQGGNDPELAIYSADGLLVATTDDIDQYFDDLQARLIFGVDEGLRGTLAGDLPLGEYYLAVAGYNAVFDWSQFAVMPDSAVEGDLTVNFRLNETLIDCNGNGAPDVCDLALGVSPDVNSNAVPDDCEDCNANSVLDPAEIAAGSSRDCNGSGVPDECEAAGPLTRLYVAQNGTGAKTGVDWANAMPELADALAQLPCGEVAEVWVAAGTYSPAGVGRDKYQSLNLPGGFALYGGFAGWETDLSERDIQAHPTVLSGDLRGNDYADFVGVYPILAACIDADKYGDPPGECAPYDFDGDGHFTDLDYMRLDNSDALIRVTDAADPVVVDGFTLSGAATYGAIYAVNSSVVVRNCRFVQNQALAGGGILQRGGQLAAMNCEFTGNVAITRRTLDFDYDGGGGVLSADGEIDLIHCRFFRNLSGSTGMSNPGSYGGALAVQRGIGRLTGCVFSGSGVRGRWGSIGGAMAFVSSQMHLEGCTVLHNYVTADGGSAIAGGLYALGGTLRVRNSIVWDNGRLDDETEMIPHVGIVATVADDVAHSCIQGNVNDFPGSGNIYQKPRLVDPLGPDGAAGTGDENLRLRPDSPCIDAGSNGAVAVDAFDVDGDGDIAEPLPWDIARDARFVDDPCTFDTGTFDPLYPELAIADMGAFEYAGGAIDDGRDCNSNAYPDACEGAVGRVFFDEGFDTESLDPQHWSLPVEGAHALSVCSSLTGGWWFDVDGQLESADLDFSGLQEVTLTLSVCADADAQWRVLFWDGVTWAVVDEALVSSNGQRTVEGLVLPGGSAQTAVRLRLEAGAGIVIDDIRLIGFAYDCDSNGVLDVCDIADGVAGDLDFDNWPDVCDDDMDGDGVANLDDACPLSTWGHPVNGSGRPLGDMDDDCLVTVADYEVMEVCLWLSGPGGDPIFDECYGVFDFDRDADVDLADFAVFQQVLDR